MNLCIYLVYNQLRSCFKKTTTWRSNKQAFLWTYQLLRCGCAAAPWAERWLPRPRWPRPPLCPGPAHRGRLLLRAGCSQWESTTAAHRQKLAVKFIPTFLPPHLKTDNRRHTCTKSGMVLRPLMTTLLWRSLARIWSAPVQPSTISSIRTPSC